MERKVRSAALFLVLYILIFVVGFRAGEIYNRMQRGYKTEVIAVPGQKMFYVVEEKDYGTYKQSDISECDNNNVLIKLLSNDKLRPLLKFKKVEIYDANGEKVY